MHQFRRWNDGGLYGTADRCIRDASQGILPASMTLRRAPTLWFAIFACVASAAQAFTVAREEWETKTPIVYFVPSYVGWEPSSNVSINLTNQKPARNTWFVIANGEHIMSWTREFVQRPLEDLVVDAAGSLSTHWRTPFVDRLIVNFTLNADARAQYLFMVWNLDREEIKLSGTVSVVNPDGNQLQVEKYYEPEVCRCFGFLFIWTTLGYGGYLLARRSPEERTAMHLLFMFVLFLKGVWLLSRSSWTADLRKTGDEDFWSGAAIGLVGKVQEIAELMMFLLTAIGWKFARPFITELEVRFAVATCAMSFYLCVMEVAFYKFPLTVRGYMHSRQILHSLCYFVVLVAINCNIQVIQVELINTPASVEAAQTYKKWNAYKTLRGIFMAFLVSPIIEIYIQKAAIVPWDRYWLLVGIILLRTWIVYMWLLVTFSELPNPTPLKLADLFRHAPESDEEDIGLEREMPGINVPVPTPVPDP